MDVTVVGAGVIGLSTALALEQAGHRVQVVAAGSRGETTSAVAGAVWFPYKVGPPAKVAGWAARTRDWLLAIARDAPAAGVDVLTGYEITPDSGTAARPYWAAQPTMEGDALAADDLEVSRAPAPVTGAPLAWQFVAPRAQPSLFLPWLESQLSRPIERRTVTELAAEPGDVVVNCTGLAARDLVGDELVVPLLGQIVIAEQGAADLAVTVTDDRNPDAIFYIIPRRHELVLGGCSLLFPPGAEPAVDPAISARIVEQARALGISVGATRTVRAGLRPYRSEVRLERDPHHSRIIHNYGHGGAGFTLCRGCAEDVAALV